MSKLLGLSILAFLTVFASVRCFALMELEDVSKERAKALGLEIRVKAAGPDVVRIELEFAAKGELKGFSRVDLDIRDGEKLLVSSTLQEERPGSGRVAVGFAADRTQLEKITLRIVTRSSERSMVGHDIRVKNFIEAEKIR
ncbi:MAG: hypothetical protein ACO1QS_09280 [Verrucomicrobiota bacterium]